MTKTMRATTSTSARPREPTEYAKSNPRTRSMLFDRETRVVYDTVI